jgi:VWFA-related protein
MKTVRFFLCICYFGFGLISFHYGQEDRHKQRSRSIQTDIQEEDYKVRVTVDEVRLDAVVIDGKGHQITDLTAADFEIYQDGLLQNITYCTYISDRISQPRSGINPAKEPFPIPRASAAKLTRDQVRRTIAFIVDNQSMSFKQVSQSRMAVRKFVENQMQPGYLVAILPTSGGNASFLMFTAEQRHLMATIDGIKWYSDVRAAKSLPQYPAIIFAIQALRDMPGRKSLIVITPRTLAPHHLLNSLDEPLRPMTDEAAFMRAMDKVADQALRAGVVIHTLDIFGLIGGIPDDNVELEHLDSMLAQNRIPLSQKTGGLFLSNSNFFVNGIGAANEEMKGYYLLSYIPPPETYAPGGESKYRRIQVKVKRPGIEVHHRDGFYGTTKPTDMTAAYRDKLLDALFSPFQYGDLLIHLAAGFIEDPQKGYLLQAWLNLDGHQVSFAQENNETLIALSTSAVTTDVSGMIRDTSRATYTIKVKKEQLASIRDNGVSFAMEIPAKASGTYYVRVALQDKESGRIGSAYQYVDIPELKSGRLAMSSIFVTQPGSKIGRSQALRNYAIGECLDYSATIYNALYKKKQPPELTTQFILYKDGIEVLKSDSENVDLTRATDYKRIPIRNTLSLDDTLQPGDYVLQLLVEDKKAQKKHSVVSQALDFNLRAR